MDFMLRDYGVEHGKSQGKTVPRDKPAFLAKSPLARAYLPADQTRSFKSRCMSNLFMALDRPDVEFASKEISRAMAQPTMQTKPSKRFVRCHLTAPKLLWCHPRQPMLSKIVEPSDANWARCPVTRKSSGCTHLMLGRHPICAGTTTQAVISLLSRECEVYAAVRGACRTLLTGRHGCWTWASVCQLSCARTAQLQRDWRPDKSRASTTHPLSQLRGCNKQSHTRKFESSNKLDRQSELLKRFGCHKSAGRADVALENIWWCHGFMWLCHAKKDANMLRDNRKFMTS